MLDGDEKEGVGWTDGFLLREPVPENALLGSASQSRLIKLCDDGGKNPEERDMHYMMLFIANLQKRERRMSPPAYLTVASATPPQNKP